MASFHFQMLSPSEKLAFENGKTSSIAWLVTLTLSQVILHTVVHHLSTSTYMPNFIEIGDTFCRQTDVHMDGWTDI